MKIYYISDIHLEFLNKYKIKNILKYFDIISKEDILILNGDICNIRYQLEDLIIYFKNKVNKIIYVSGNHEYYGLSLKATNSFFESMSLKYDHFIFLNNSTVEINNLLFAGSTGWSNVDTVNITGINDFKYITNFKKQDCIDEYYKAYDFFKSIESKKDYKYTIFITHFLPSSALIAEEYKFSKLNDYFSNGLYDKNINLSPDYWIYGHDHNKQFDKLINDTLFLTNQGDYGNIILRLKYIELI